MKPFIPFVVVALIFSNIIAVQCLDVDLMLELCNIERKKAGVPPLSYNDKYMSQNDILTHDDPAGSLGTRFEKHGYSYSSAGENVAEGYDDEKSVMKGWMESPGHRANILKRSFKEAGFGKSGSYWTQDFGAGSGSGGKHSGKKVTDELSDTTDTTDKIVTKLS
ncbi:18958_t:CDS:2, partial [Gigaspora rosea]